MVDCYEFGGPAVTAWSPLVLVFVVASGCG